MKLFQQIRDKVPSIKVALTKQYSVNEKEMYYFSPFLILNFIFQFKRFFKKKNALITFQIIALFLTTLLQNNLFAKSNMQNEFIDQNVKDLEKFLHFEKNKNVYQLFTHGRPGELLINNEWKNAEQIVAFLKPQLSNEITHINIYGCEFAKGEIGLSAVNELQAKLGISIAASNNITGKDGDWQLEVGQPKALISLPNYKSNLQYGSGPCMNAQTVTMNFNSVTNPPIITGTVNTVGSTYRYSNVLQGAGVTQQVDAVFTLNSLNFGGSTLQQSTSFLYDAPASTIGIENNFQPSFVGTFNPYPALGTYVMSNQWTVNFYLPGTTTPVNLPIIVEVFDNDGATSSYKINEIVTFNTAPNSIVTSAAGATPSTETIVGNTVTSNNTGINGITNALQYMVYANYASVSSFQFTFKDSIQVSATGLTFGNRFHSMIIGCQNPGATNFPALADPDYESGAVSSTSGGVAISNVAANDTVSGVQVSLGAGGNATISEISFPSGISLNTATGAVTVMPGMAIGSYPVSYQLCDKLSPVNCIIQLDTIYVLVDTDGDGISDVTDIDDDNDGVLDEVECPKQKYIYNGSMEDYVNCPNLSTNSTIALATGWTSYNDDGQLMVNNATCYSPRPGASWSLSTDMPSGFHGTNWMGIHSLSATDGEAVENELSTTMPVGCYNLNLAAGYVKHGIYQSDSKILVEGVTASGVAYTLGVIPVTNQMTSTNPNWVQYSLNFTTTQPFEKIRFSARTNSSGVGYMYFDYVGISDCTYAICDDDGDGIPNTLDLDSDGDGCSDAKESGVSSLVTTSPAPADMGATTGLANSVAPSPYNDNGFSDALQATTDTNSYKGKYTYQYAISSFYSICEDTDGDGITDIIDIDDDNDGILDAVEAPDCYYSSSEWLSGNRTDIIVTAGLVSPITDEYHYPSKLVDGNNGTTTTSYAVRFLGMASSAPAPATVYQFEMPMPVQLDTIFLGYANTSTHFGNGNVLKLQGFNIGDTVWTDLNAGLTYNTTTAINGVSSVPGVTGTVNANYFPVTQNAGKYQYYRIYWVSGGSVNSLGYSNEVYFSTNTAYVSSANPKTTCASDIDGDGITNDKDLDSDGDDCSDALEAGVSALVTLTNAPAGMGATTGLANSVAPGPYNDNGFSDALQSNTDINAYKDNYNYQFASSSFINLCADTDGDGISDIIDVDDDNDGILDAAEAPDCYYSFSEWLSGNRNDIEVTTDLAMNATYNLPDDLVDGVNGTSATSYAVRFNATTTSPATVYEFAMPMPVQLDTLFLGYATANSHFNANTILKLQGSNDNTTWTDLNAGLTYTTTNSSAINNGTTSIPGVGTITGANIFPVTQHAGKYQYYRIYWVSGGGINANGYSNEAYFSTNTAYVPSANPKISCSTDTDGDGITNEKDLDSDNDGCVDAVEGGAFILPAQLVSAGGIASVGSGSTASNQNICGGVGCVSTSGTNIGLPQLINPSDYSNATGQSVKTAQDSTLNFCLDYDSDGYPDYIDLDDDNDGILDGVECGSVVKRLNTASDWALVEDATAADSTITLTTATNFQRGAAWYPYQIDITQPFNYKYKAYFGNNDAGADGIAFVISADPRDTAAIGACCWGLGAYDTYSGDGCTNTYESGGTGCRGGIYPSLILEMDTYYNAAGSGDSYGDSNSSDHLSINNNSNANQVWPGTYVGLTNIENGLWHNVEVDYNGSVLKVYWDNVLKITTTTNISTDFLDGNSLAYIGYTSSTGSNTNLQRIIPRSLTATIYSECTDTDGDGIPNYLDLDSDGDGCPDAIEGGASFNNTNLEESSLPGGNTSTTTTSYNGTANYPVDYNLGNNVDANGVPTVAIPPLYSTYGQTVNLSQDKSSQDADCCAAGYVAPKVD